MDADLLGTEFVEDEGEEVRGAVHTHTHTCTHTHTHARTHTHTCTHTHTHMHTQTRTHRLSLRCVGGHTHTHSKHSRLARAHKANQANFCMCTLRMYMHNIAYVNAQHWDVVWEEHSFCTHHLLCHVNPHAHMQAPAPWWRFLRYSSRFQGRFGRLRSARPGVCARPCALATSMSHTAVTIVG
jgi:hypothetical protein